MSCGHTVALSSHTLMTICDSVKGAMRLDMGAAAATAIVRIIQVQGHADMAAFLHLQRGCCQ